MNNEYELENIISLTRSRSNKVLLKNSAKKWSIKNEEMNMNKED